MLYGMFSTLVLVAILVYILYTHFLLKNDGIKIRMRWEQEDSVLPEVPPLGIIATNLTSKFSLVKLFAFFANVNRAVLLKFLGIRFAIINDTKLAKESFQNLAFAGKASSEGYCFHSQGEYGLLNTHGKKWEEQRKFCLRHLRNFGFGKKSMEDLMQSEIEEFIRKLCQFKGEPVCPNKIFYLPVLNSIWMILAGERVGDQNSKIYKIAMAVFEDVAKAFKIPECFILLLPLRLETLNWIAKWIPFFSGWKRLRSNVLGLRMYLDKLVRSRGVIESMDLGEAPMDFIDAYRQEISKCTDSSSIFYKENGVMNLLGTLTEFFIAGGDTTATMISWCVLHLARNPEMQREIQNEIDCAVGRDRLPGIKDRIYCPFTEAFIWEVLRTNPVTITTTPRQVSQDTTIGQYKIKKGTAVLLNIVGIHQDKSIWGDPEKFRPERFLVSGDGDENQRVFLKNENMIAFSIGKRKCPGEQLAKDNLFLFVSSICHRFNVQVYGLNAHEQLNMEPRYNGGFLVPCKFYVNLLER